MSYFSSITGADLITFEGATVTRVSPVQDKQSKEVSHYRFSVLNEDGDVEFRNFRVEEISHLIESERLVVDRGYHSSRRQNGRALYGKQDIFGATKAQRDAVDLIVFYCGLMRKYELMGMKRTRAGVGAFRHLMETEYRAYQARKMYGTEKPNASQFLKPLPCEDTLLVNSRKYRQAEENPNVFVVPRAEPLDLGLQASADFHFVIEQLKRYVWEPISMTETATDLIEKLEAINADRIKNHNPLLFKVKSTRQYIRDIDKYLDPFLVTLQKKGLAAARKLCGTTEGGLSAETIGQIVQADAWQFHLVTLDVTRERYNQMTEEERSNVKKVRRWVVVIIDIATRAILGFSICRTPNENASLEALRMVFMDKTYLFRDAGIEGSDWSKRCAIQEMMNDCGSEFGKNPFGGALFAQAVRTLSSSLMNTVAGISHLRGHVERLFWTIDLKWARQLPGYTGPNPWSRNDRKPGSEACITDDELHTLFVQFIAEYHKTEHGGLDGRTPNAVWEEKTQDKMFDLTQMPSPSQLREACGFYSEAKVTDKGIQFAGAVYSNEFTRRQRKGPLIDRIAAPDQKVEIKVDPFELGSISVLAKGELVPVRCLDPKMYGKSLRQWRDECHFDRMKAKIEALEQKDGREEARSLWKNFSKDIARKADVGLFGYTEKEIKRIVREMEFGKDRHDKPYIGLDEHNDPMQSGFEIQNDVFEDDDVIREESDPDTPNDMDLYRSGSKSRKRKGRGKKS